MGGFTNKNSKQLKLFYSPCFTVTRFRFYPLCVAQLNSRQLVINCPLSWLKINIMILQLSASILNLCVISLDRYWAITDPFSYPMRMTRKKAAALIGVVWVCSGAISFPAIVWWRAAREGDMPAYKCTFTEHLGYLVFSSTISFYLPLLVMVFTYCRIYRAAVVQTRSLKLGTKQVLMASGELQLTLRIHRGGTTREGHHHHHSATATSTPEGKKLIFFSLF